MITCGTHGRGAHSLCFVIGPYGEDDTETRKWSDFLVSKIIAPAVIKIEDLRCDRGGAA